MGSLVFLGDFGDGGESSSRAGSSRLAHTRRMFPARGARQEIFADNPPGDDETVVVDDVREGARRYPRGPTGPASSKIGCGATAPRDRDSIKL